jgi:hypothetical protein
MLIEKLGWVALFHELLQQLLADRLGPGSACAKTLASVFGDDERCVEKILRG